MSISVSRLTKVYGEQKAIDNLTFSISKGELVGFLGPNGAGKSTTMKILSGYLAATSGEAKISGLDVAKEPLVVKRKIGYLPETNPLYPDMYVREMLSFTAGLYGLSDRKQRIGTVIEITGLEKESHKKIGALSKGYKQRVGLARALLPDPEVLILDEPTSGLDPNQLLEIRQVFKELAKEKTILLSSHILQEIKALCERVIIINEGKIIADDLLSVLNQQQPTSILTVEFDQEIPKSQLEQIETIQEIRQENPKTWCLTSDDLGHTKKKLLQLALQNNWNIVSLQTDQASLETLFHQLTNKKS